MAIYHLNQGHVSRSTGRSSVQSAAYITGANLHESRRNLDIRYQNRHSDIAFSQTLSPDHAKEEYKTLGVWDHLESFEDAYAAKRFKSEETLDKHLTTAQTAMTIVVALPRELDMTDAKNLVEDFAKERFVSRNLIVTYAIHDDEGNPHAHLLISRRAINDLGEFSEFKDRDICTPSALRSTRKLWADLTNQYLERAGFESRITEKSFADLGINLEPSQHRGWVSDKLESMGVQSRIVVENAEIFENNREALKANPEIILNALTSKSATFTQTDLLKAVRARVGDDPKLVGQIFEHALNASHAIGIGIDGMHRYTSSSYKESEDQALSLLERHMTLNGVQVSSDPLGFEEGRREGIRYSILSDQDFSCLSDAQREAFLNLTQEKPLSVLVGRAGAGKTTSLKAVCRYYECLGYSIMGTSLSALAAKNLGDETRIESATLHSLLYKWERYAQAEEKFLSYDSVMEEGAFKQLQWFKDLKIFKKDVLTEKSLILVDEAGMIGTRQWKDLLHHAEKHHAKIIAVGDDHQFKAIDAGDFFREIVATSKTYGTLSILSTIHRQKQAWMCDASHLFAELHTKEALSLYEQKGHIHATSHLEEDIARAYLEKTKAGQEGLVLSFTNVQCQALNNVIRTQLREAGFVAQQDCLRLRHKDFAIGDKLVFLKNDKTNVHLMTDHGERIPQDFIRNGTVGTLESVNHLGVAVIRLEKNKVALVDTQIYTDLDYGYALTTHKAQGQTVDFTFVAASKHMDAKGIYVAMTRHRLDTTLFYFDQEFPSFKALCSHLSTFEHKDLVKDYTIKPEHEEAWQRVQDYKLCILDAAFALKEKDFESYQSLKKDQVALGKEILNNFESHKLYLHQLSLTQEMLEITTGKKQRPLSIVEEKAKLTVELYREVSILARTLRDHPQEKDAYDDARIQRDSLAKTILENYSLHKEFVLSYKGQIHKKMMENQVAYREKVLQQNNQQNNQKNTGNGKADSPDLEAKQRGFKPQSRKPYERTALDITHDLNAHIKDLAHHFLGKPTSQTSKEWRYGRKGSVVIHVAGVKQGLYSDFERGESGNAVTFIAHQMGLDKKEAFKWGANWLGHGSPHVREIKQAKVEPSNLKTQESSWIPTYPIQEDFPDLRTDPNLSYMMKGRREVARFAYQDADSNILGYVVRLEDRHGNKITPTLTYCRNEKGQHQWRFKGFGEDRPLYGLDQLKQKPDSLVLVVEGEKTCEAARKLFPEHAVVTWSGGCGAVQKSDWSVLKDKEVILWPDHDQPGHRAAEKIQGILKDQYQTPSKIISLDSTFPHKWDLADPLPEGMTKEHLREKGGLYKEFTTEKIKRQAERFGAKFLTGYEDKETKLINTLYRAYQKEFVPFALEKAISVGLYMNKAFIEYKSDPFLAYEIGYNAALLKEEDRESAFTNIINIEKEGDLRNHTLKVNNHFAEHLKNITQEFKFSQQQRQKTEQFIKLSSAFIEKQALKIGRSILAPEVELPLIHTLYEAYTKMYPHFDKETCLSSAISIGVLMNKHSVLSRLSLLSIESYKISLATHLVKPEKKEHRTDYEHVVALHKEGKLDECLKQEHHHPLFGHNIANHFKNHMHEMEKHFTIQERLIHEQIHARQMEQVHKQHEVFLSR